MAKIKKSSNTVGKNIGITYVKIVATTLCLGLITFILYKLNPLLLFLDLLLIPALVLYIRKKKISLSILKAGLRGEKEVLEILKTLSKDYIVLVNKKIKIYRKEVEFDYLVIAPKGIIIVEVKNYSGTLVGNIGGERWDQKKEVRGKTIIKQVNNPMKQLSKQEKALRDLLKNEKLDKVILKSILFFSNSKTVLALKEKDSRIITDSNKLLSEIHKFDKGNMSKKDRKLIYKAIKKY